MTAKSKSRGRRVAAQKAPGTAIAKAIAEVDPKPVAPTGITTALPKPLVADIAEPTPAALVSYEVITADPLVDGPVAKAPADTRTASITVGLVKGKGIASWWIRWLAKGGWSHCVALVLPGGTHVIDARADVINGIPAGVQIRPISYLKGEKCLWLEIPCTPDQARAVQDAADSVLDRPYDFHGIVDFATDQADNSWKRAQNFFCSALGSWLLWKGGILGAHVLVPFTNIDPGDVLGLYWGLGARTAATPIGLQ